MSSVDVIPLTILRESFSEGATATPLLIRRRAFRFSMLCMTELERDRYFAVDGSREAWKKSSLALGPGVPVSLALLVLGFSMALTVPFSVIMFSDDFSSMFCSILILASSKFAISFVVEILKILDGE